jgi:REP element-mobilizing transposase RayT
VDRFWLLTTTFYGNWLEGDERGFVSRVRDQRPDDQNLSSRQVHNLPGTDYDSDMPALRRVAQERLRGEVIKISFQQAGTLLQQFQETARHRNWNLLATAIMPNHVHLVVGVGGDPEPTRVLADFKAYGSRALNKIWGRPQSGTWWTYDGSKRKLQDDQAVHDAIHYVKMQPRAHIIWIAEDI